MPLTDPLLLPAFNVEQATETLAQALAQTAVARDQTGGHAAHQAALDVSSQVFELTGASATSQRFGLDRFWRNARVHTLHDPVDYKLRDLGRHALLGDFPVPTPYS